MKTSCDSSREAVIVYSAPETCVGTAQPMQDDWKLDEPWTAILVEEMARSFREFAKESGRLARLAQRRKRCGIPSEGFNLLLAQRMDEVEEAFRTYLRRKEELVNHIRATAWRATKARGNCSASARQTRASSPRTAARN